MYAYFDGYLNKSLTDNYNMNKPTDTEGVGEYEDWAKEQSRIRSKDKKEEFINSYYKDYMDRVSSTKLPPLPKGVENFPPEDNVNSPDHYTHNGIEAIDVIEAKLTLEQFQGYLQGSVMKYLLRANYKGKRIEDLKKAQWYLDNLVRTFT